MSTLHFDADLAKRVETAYATPDVAATRIAAFQLISPRHKECGVDVGCGPGYLTRELALAVGLEGHVFGIDVSDSMLELARRRCDGLKQVDLVLSDAKMLVGDAESFDFACALQVYCYVKELDEALHNLRHRLKRRGRAVILDTDFAGVIWESKNRTRMRRVMDAYDAHVAWPDLPRVLPEKLRNAGFEIFRCEVIPILSLQYHPHTLVYGLSRFIHQFVVKNANFPVDEADAWLAEFDDLEEKRSFFFSMNRFAFVILKQS